MTVVIAVVMTLGAVFALALAEAAVTAVQSTRAQTAADAAALAAVDHGTQSARSVAERNGARLTSIEISGLTATVTVSVGRASATARASAEP